MGAELPTEKKGQQIHPKKTQIKFYYIFCNLAFISGALAFLACIMLLLL